MSINRNYKDRLFRMLFGAEENKCNILSLYNALNGTSYEDTGVIELKTIEDVIYVGMKNDVSFLIGNELSLWEQQSTYNPNMPLRGFIYYEKMYESYVTSSGSGIYGRTLNKIPAPRYVVFYIGDTERPAIEKMRLSDAFVGGDPNPDYEWTATVYNLNSDKNSNLLDACRPLADYTEIIQRIKAKVKTMSQNEDLARAIDEVILSCIEDGILAEFLTKHRSEVVDVCLTEFNEKQYAETLRSEGREEGRVEGLEEGRKEGRPEGILIGRVRELSALIADGILTAEAAAQRANLPVDELLRIAETINSEEQS